MIKIYEALAREKYTYNNCCLKKNQNAPRPSEHPPVRGKNVVVSHVQRSIGCQPEKLLYTVAKSMLSDTCC